MSTTPDRITKLLAQNRVTGIDFIYVDSNQQDLDVYFLRSVTTLAIPLPGTITHSAIKIYSPGSTLPLIEADPTVALTWTTILGLDVLQLKTKERGDFSLYRFRIDDSRIDRFFNDISFSFKANCPSDLDCKTPDHECPPDELVDFPVNYLARDFWSYRRALLDFASLRYPDWTDRLEADAGVMMAELMSAMGDEMAYYQDRVSREAYLETATQRRSIRRHARLVDYHMHDGLGANAWLDMTVEAGQVTLLAGTNVYVLGDDDVRVDFEIGHGIDDTKLPTKTYNVTEPSNFFNPHIWDEDELCLLPGTTELYLKGHQKVNLPLDDKPKNKPDGKWVLIQTTPKDPAQPARAQMVRIILVENTTDEVFNEQITHIVWEQEQALHFEFDLTVLTVRGNMVPATAGRTFESHFIIDKSPDSVLPADATVNRQGHDDTKTYLYSLPYSQIAPLVYLGTTPDHFNIPEIILEEVDFVPATNSWVSKLIPQKWEYQEALIGISSSKPIHKHFTLDDGSWQRVVRFRRIGKEIEHIDYAMNAGVTIRFGDGEFGKTPDKETAFHVKYRLGGTRRSNVASGTITHFETPVAGVKVTNPLPASGGFDAETPAELRQLAPEAFRAVTYRAVRPEDYAEAAERLRWVQKAGAAFRWTGSWLTAFVTPDPKDKVTLEKAERKDLIAQLNRFRQAGREVNVLDPEYADVDLKIEICVSSDAYPGQVKERVYEALTGKKGLRPVPGYFSPDRFTFGTSLDHTTLESAIQDVQGVKAVEQILFRRRGWFKWKEFTELSYDPGINCIIRISNDPLHPERGTITLYTHGGL